MLAGINEEVDDEALKEENNEMLFKCTNYFSGNSSHEGNATETRGTSQVVHHMI